MTLSFDISIRSEHGVTLKANLGGISDSGITNTEDIKMSIFAFNESGTPLFTSILDFSGIQKLYQYLHQISIVRDSSHKITGKFIEQTTEIEEIIKSLESVSPSLLINIFSKLGDSKVTTIIGALTNIELTDICGAFNYRRYTDELKNLEKLLELERDGDIVTNIISFSELHKYGAGQSEKIFQNWIEQNLWIFGVEYIKKHDERRIALFSDSDILMESLDGFIDLIELKRPSKNIFKFDNSHNCYFPSTDLSEVLGQSLFYLQKLDDFKLVLQEEYKVKILRPRIKIITGRTDDFNEEQYKALRMLNMNLNNMQIISYDYLLSSGKKILEQLSEETE